MLTGLRWTKVGKIGYELYTRVGMKIEAIAAVLFSGVRCLLNWSSIAFGVWIG